MQMCQTVCMMLIINSYFLKSLTCIISILIKVEIQLQYLKLPLLLYTTKL